MKKNKRKSSAGINDFLSYYREYLKELYPKSTSRTINAYKRVLELFSRFREGQETRFELIDHRMCELFSDYLLACPKEGSRDEMLSQGTVNDYIFKFKAVLHKAFVEGFLLHDIGREIKVDIPPSKLREFFEAKEIEMLDSTPCDNPIVKRAAFFTLQTGLRHIDVQNLTWNQIVRDGNNWRVKFKNKKAGRPGYLPLSAQAYELCGERKDGYIFVFNHLPDVTTCNRTILRWLKAAGIERHLTYMCFRHSFAVRLLESGNSLHVVATLLGHTRLTTTEQYWQIVDEKRRIAANSIEIQ